MDVDSKMQEQASLFDPFDLQTPWHHRKVLIEASAGTGKSFTLVWLVLRALLGIGTPLRPLRLSEILILTFTVDATHALKARIQSAIEMLGESLAGGGREKIGGVWDDLIREAELDPLGSFQRLQQAKADLSSAAIFTLHGFCFQVLKRAAYLTGEGVPVLNSQERHADLFLQGVAAFWNQALHAKDSMMRAALLEAFPAVENLAEALRPLIEQVELEIVGGYREEATFLKHYRAHQLRLSRLQKGFFATDAILWEESFRKILKKPSRRSIQGAHWVKRFHEALDRKSKPDVKKLYATLEGFLSWEISDVEVEPEERARLQWLHEALALYQGWVDPHLSLLYLAWDFCRKASHRIGWESGRLDFGALLVQLDASVASKRLPAWMRELQQQYFLIMVDEFQDTDVRQYRILKGLTEGESGCHLFLIGDPKQSIYAFRGADLATYLQASQEVGQRTHLTTQWRSQPALLEALNLLWSAPPRPFIYPEIVFRSCTTPLEKPRTHLTLYGLPVASLHLHLPPKGTIYGTQEYRREMAACCAFEVARWHEAIEAGEAKFIREDGEVDRLVQMKDLVILVRNSTEAEAMIHALSSWKIASHYSSQEVALFQTEGGGWMLKLLQAMAEHGWAKRIHALFITPSLYDNTSGFQVAESVLKEVEQTLMRGLLKWRCDGLLAAVKSTLTQLTPWIPKLKAWKTLGNFSQHAEQTLQALVDWEVSGLLKDPSSALLFLKQSLKGRGGGSPKFKPKPPHDGEPMLIISTIFKSKGLEYPVVWLPFVSAPERTQLALQWGSIRRSGATLASKASSEDRWEEGLQSARSESMRLLYVAMTRASHHLSCSIAAVAPGRQRTSAPEQSLAFSPLIHLLSGGQTSLRLGDLDALNANLEQRLKGSSWSWVEMPTLATRNEMFWKSRAKIRARSLKSITSSKSPEEDEKIELKDEKGENQTRPEWMPWSIQSYSSLHRAFQPLEPFPLSRALAPLRQAGRRKEGEMAEVVVDPLEIEPSSLFALDATQSEEKNVDPTPSAHALFDQVASLPRGPDFGECVHQILELWDFSSPPDEVAWSLILKRFSIEMEHLSCIKAWLQHLVQQKLWPGGCALAELEREAKMAEMNFCIQVPALLSPLELFRQVRGHGWLRKSSLKPDKMSKTERPFLGGIQGFIDLVFCWEGRYYWVDYKTNHLGERPENYGSVELEEAMASHDYDLQMALYGVALHRHLKLHLPNYHPDLHLGQGFYLFLRGLSLPATLKSESGIWRSGLKPDAILALDRMILRDRP